MVAIMLYQDLGKIQWGFISGPVYNFKVTGHRLNNEQIRIGLTYVFGDQHIPPSLLDND